MISYRLTLSALLLVALVAAEVDAQPRPIYEPTTTHIFPAGGRRGSSVDICIGTECFPPGSRLRFWGQGIRATESLELEVQDSGEPSPRRMPTQIPLNHPREWSARIEIAANAELGPRLWRVSCAQGGSGGRPFIIGDLPEYIERESNSLPERAERVTLPLTINGRIHGERDLDYFVFTAAAGDVITCDCVAGRIGSPLDPVLEVFGPEGKRAAVQQMRVGSDPLIAFRASVAGDYRVMIGNVSQYGERSAVYRLTLSKQPIPWLAWPPGGQAGAKGMIQLLSLTGQSSSDTLQSASLPIEFPHDTNEIWHQATGGGSIPLVAEKTAPQIETEEDDKSVTGSAAANGTGRTLSLQLPTVFYGRFSTQQDEDWFAFEARANETIAIECGPALQASFARPQISIMDSSGKTVAESNSLAGRNFLARLEFKPAVAGTYRLRARDVQHGTRGGPAFIYRLSVAVEEPDFALRVAGDAAEIVQGASTSIDVTVDRFGGFSGPIELIVRDLPSGVTAAPATIAAGQQQGKITLTASPESRCMDQVVQVIGRATFADKNAAGADKNAAASKPVERVATAPHLGVGPEGCSLGPALVDHLFLTVRHKPLFKLHCLEAYQYAHRGSIYPYRMTVERLDGYRGEITVQIADRQNRDLDGIDMIPTVVSGSDTECDLPIILPETMHVNAFGQTQLYAQAWTRFQDRFGQPQSLLVLSEKRNIIRTLPTLVRLTAESSEASARRGTTVRVPLRLERALGYLQPISLALIDSPAGVLCPPSNIASEKCEAQLTIASDAPAGKQTLRFRAAGDMAKHLQIVSEATITLTITP